MLHTGFQNTSLPEVSEAVHHLIWLLYQNLNLPQQPLSGKTPSKGERNEEICRLYQQGITVPELAKQFGISKPRIYEILKLPR